MGENILGNCLCYCCSAGVFVAGCAALLVAAFPITEIALGVVYLHECPAAPVIPVYVMVCGIVALLLMGLLALPKLLCPAAPNHLIWTVCLLSLVLFTFIWFLYGSYLIYSVYPPNYTKTTLHPNTPNTTIFTPAAPHNKPDISLENQNQSLPSLNQTGMINNTNQTLMKMIQTLSLRNSSSQTTREHLNTPQARRVEAAVSYCHKTVYLFAFWTTTLVYALAANAAVIFICIYGCMNLLNKLLTI